MTKAIRWTDEQLREFMSRRAGPMVREQTPAAEPQQAGKSMGKYGGQKVETAEGKFDSKKEYYRWLALCAERDAGKINGLERQVEFVLAPAVTLDGKRKPALRYFADAVYWRDGIMVVEDTKSEITRKKEAYRIKKHLMKSVLGIDILET